MEEQVIYIRNMVCPRCIMAVQQIFTEIGHPEAVVNMGNVQVNGFSQDHLPMLAKKLEVIGFELIGDANAILVEQIKSIVIEMVHRTTPQGNIKNSVYLSQRLHRSYSSLSKLFSKSQGITIERYIILQKIERIKELLEYGELNISEIADLLGYGSLSHMSRQFKSVTNYSPNDYKKKTEGRKGIDSV